MKGRSSAHTIYKTKDGKRVPSVTTITGVMDKPNLYKWHNEMGLQGIDTAKYVDALAAAGILAHYFVECDLTQTPRDSAVLSEYAAVDIDRAEVSFVKYLEWRHQNTIELRAHEMELVSECNRYGGTLDLLLVINGILTLVDVKTCKALYGDSDEKWAQVAGYDLLLEENGTKVERCAILRIGRDPAEGFEFVEMTRRELQRDRFLCCRALYDCQARLKKVT